MQKNKTSVEKINPGAVIDKPGNSKSKLGAHKSYKILIDFSKCIKCAKCWMYCPDAAFKKNASGFFESNPFYCKGCGICVKICPTKCMKLVEVKK